MKQELLVINPKEYGLEEKQAEKMTSGLTVVLSERKALEEIYNAVIAKELNPETFKEARELRLKVQKNRTTGIEAWHKTNKAFYLAGGRFVDAYKNKEVIVNEQMEERLLEIEKYEEKLAADLKAKLKSEREELLLPYEVDTTYVSIAEMTQEQFDGYLATNKLAFETKQEQERLAEVTRIEAEKKAEEAILEAERLEKERVEAQRLENEKLKAEQERLQKEQAEKDRLAKIESDKQAALIAAEKAKSDKLAAELKAKEEAEKQKQEEEKARIEAEEAERLAKEKALLLAPDKEKVKNFAIDFGKLGFPELTTKEGKEMAVKVKAEIEKLKAFINDEYKKMK